jgi:lipopolysaccharide/colanic/teichoic acid biosynthesis glycosyltransferase/glycosyltransferase involved in cell wall biosynthesis
MSSFAELINERCAPTQGAEVAERRRSRLLFVDNDAGSFVAYRLDLAREARAAGYEVHIATPPGRAEALLLREGFHFHPIPMTRSGLSLWQELGCIHVLFYLYRGVNPDLVHNLRLKPVLYGGIAAYYAGVPSVVSTLTGLGHLFTSDSFKARIMRRLTQAGLKRAFQHPNHRVIFQNPDDRAIFVKSGTLPTEKSVLIKGSGVDVSAYQPTPEPPGEPVVLLVSRMLWDKGIQEFVDAAGLLRAEGVRATFALVGDTDSGNPTAIPVRQLTEWRAHGPVEWWGHQDNVKSILQRCHIACLPSYREGVPKFLIEAAACGRPIVTTDVPGCREIVQHGRNGLLVPARNCQALADALRQLIADPSAREAMGARGRVLATADFSLGGVVSNTLDVYKKLHEGGERRQMPSRRGSAFAKRMLDCAIALPLLVLLAPLMAMIAVAVKLCSPGPALYRGTRVGLNGESFQILKFRSMVVRAEALGGSATPEDDPRITRVGRFVRHYKLDELPQLLNVLKGEMSLVGPRPEVHKFVAKYSDEEKNILRLRPGITDWASIWDFDEGAALKGSEDPEGTYERVIRPTKLALQLHYFRDHSLGVDLRILFHTLIKLFHSSWVPKELATYTPATAKTEMHIEIH